MFYQQKSRFALYQLQTSKTFKLPSLVILFSAFAMKFSLLRSHVGYLIQANRYVLSNFMGYLSWLSIGVLCLSENYQMLRCHFLRLSHYSPHIYWKTLIIDQTRFLDRHLVSCLSKFKGSLKGKSELRFQQLSADW